MITDRANRTQAPPSPGAGPGDIPSRRPIVQPPPPPPSTPPSDPLPPPPPSPPPPTTPPSGPSTGDASGGAPPSGGSTPGKRAIELKTWVLDGTSRHCVTERKPAADAVTQVKRGVRLLKA